CVPTGRPSRCREWLHSKVTIHPRVPGVMLVMRFMFVNGVSGRCACVLDIGVTQVPRRHAVLTLQRCSVASDVARAASQGGSGWADVLGGMRLAWVGQRARGCAAASVMRA